MNELKSYKSLQGTFHLFLASLAMTLAISYCTTLASLCSKRSEEGVGMAIGCLIGVYLIPSLLFYIFVNKWINKNLSTVLWIYCIISLLFTFGDLIHYGTLPSFPLALIILFVDCVWWLLVFFPLINLVATPTLVISSIVDSFKKRNNTKNQANTNIPS